MYAFQNSPASVHAAYSMHSLSKLEADLERITLALNAPALTTVQARAFCMIGKAAMEGEPINAQDLCERLGLSWSTALTTVCRFVNDGFVMRQQSEEDGRVKSLLLTERGMRAVVELTR